MKFQSTNLHFLHVKERADRAIHYLMIASLLTSGALSFFYETFWLFGIGGFGLYGIYFISTKLSKQTDTYQYVASIVFAGFVALFLQQMRGMVEMHFFTFIFSVILIAYMNWKVQIPFISFIFFHHILFGYLQYNGLADVYVEEIDQLLWPTFLFHISLELTAAVGAGYLANAFYQQTLKSGQQKMEMALQKEELRVQKEQIDILLKDTSKQQKNLEDSIMYACSIQQIVLPDEVWIKSYIPDSFIYYQPKDIVSGDFFWFYTTENDVYLAAIDCTGHGVPGAFVSMIASEKLNEILAVRELHHTGEILDQLDDSFRATLKQSTSGNRDGMTVALLRMNVADRIVEFSGAHAELLCFDTNGEMSRVKSAKFPVGFWLRKDDKSSFPTEVLQMDELASIYMYSDGIQDQFYRDNERKKFSQRRLRELLASFQGKPFDDQLSEFEQVFDDWKGDNKQTDDVLLIGLNPATVKMAEEVKVEEKGSEE